MTTLVHRTKPPAVSPRARAVRAGNFIAGFYRSWKNRREFMLLGEMTDTQLADIGLCRTDLHVAVGLPFGNDPTAHLNAIAHERLKTVSRQAH